MPLYNPTAGSDASLTFTDITTNDSSTSKHGFLKKLDNTATNFMNGQGVWSAPSGSGAPASVEYVTTATDGTLSAEVAIPGLAGSPDIISAAGAGTSEEYDTATTGLTWDVSPSVTVDSDTTFKSHLYVRTASGQNQGTKAWAPAGAFDARAKVALGHTASTQACDIALLVADTGLTNKVFTALHRTASVQSYDIQAYTYTGAAYTQRGSTWVGVGNELYVRVTRDGSNNVSFYWSNNGKTWAFIATQSFTFTVAKLGFRFSGDGTTFDGTVDWLRTDV